MPIVIVVGDTPASPEPAGTTRSDIVEEILSNVQGFTASPDQVTSLAADLTATATQLRVDSSVGIASGIIEVGDELMWVSHFDDASGDIRLLPKGRGWRGTAAVSHPQGETVVISPAVPRSAVVRELNNTIRSLFPALYAVGVDEFTYDSATQMGYPIPVGAEMLLDVRYKDTQDNWQRVRTWEVENTPGAPGVVRFCGVPLGQTVQVVFGLRPSTLDSADDLLSEVGLSASVKDLLVSGVLGRLLPMIDVARLGVQHAIADELANARQLGSATSLAREFKKDFAERLAAEQAALQRRYPGRIHFTR